MNLTKWDAAQRSDQNSEGWGFFKPPYNRWTPEAILAYYQTRSTVQYFPVLDEEQASPKMTTSLLANRFEFNHEAYDLPDGFDWTHNPSPDLEWLILLHKFYYAVGLGDLHMQTGDERYACKWMELTNAWIDGVPISFLTSDVMGRRVQNWIYAHYYFVTLASSPMVTPAFYLKFLNSLYEQVCYLQRNLTPARNHRTIELCAIFLAAVVFPEFKEARQWLEFARQELLCHLQTDLLADGVQYELSTDYHHLVLKNYLGVRRLASLNHIPMPAVIDALLKKALEFSLFVHKPDGVIPSLSDGDQGSFLSMLQRGYELYGEEAMRYVATQGGEGRPPEERSKVFPQSGYLILRSGWGHGTKPYCDEHFLIFDCGPLGVGNHGHLDLLSFEAAAFGRSLIVDPGRYTYDESGETNWRALFRGTRYHNTVQVDGKNQTRYVYHKNRYRIQGPEPERELKAFVSTPDYDYVCGVARSHEYPVVHERRIFFPWLEYWIISDSMQASEAHHYDLFFHLAPEAWERVQVEQANQTRIIHAPHLVLAQPERADSDREELFIEKGYVSPTYGVKHPAPIVRLARDAADTTFHTVVYPYPSEAPSLIIEVLPVLCGDRPCAPEEAFALAITISQGERTFRDTYFNGPVADSSQPYRFGEFSYSGTLLCIRQDESGQILKVQGQPGLLSDMDGRSFQVEHDAECA